MRLTGGYLVLLTFLLGPLAAWGQPLALQEEVPAGAHEARFPEDAEVLQALK